MYLYIRTYKYHCSNSVVISLVCTYFLLNRERSQPPRLASTGSLEELLAKKWMNLIQSQEHRKAELEQTFKEEKANLEREIEQEKPNFEAELYRQGVCIHCAYLCERIDPLLFQK